MAYRHMGDGYSTNRDVTDRTNDDSSCLTSSNSASDSNSALRGLNLKFIKQKFESSKIATKQSQKKDSQVISNKSSSQPKRSTQIEQTTADAEIYDQINQELEQECNYIASAESKQRGGLKMVDKDSYLAMQQGVRESKRDISARYSIQHQPKLPPSRSSLPVNLSAEVTAPPPLPPRTNSSRPGAIGNTLSPATGASLVTLTLANNAAPDLPPKSASAAAQSSKGSLLESLKMSPKDSVGGYTDVSPMRTDDELIDTTLQKGNQNDPGPTFPVAINQGFFDSIFQAQSDHILTSKIADTKIHTADKSAGLTELPAAPFHPPVPTRISQISPLDVHLGPAPALLPRNNPTSQASSQRGLYHTPISTNEVSTDQFSAEVNCSSASSIRPYKWTAEKSDTDQYNRPTPQLTLENNNTSKCNTTQYKTSDHLQIDSSYRDLGSAVVDALTSRGIGFRGKDSTSVSGYCQYEPLGSIACDCPQEVGAIQWSQRLSESIKDTDTMQWSQKLPESNSPVIEEPKNEKNQLIKENQQQPTISQQIMSNKSEAKLHSSADLMKNTANLSYEERAPISHSIIKKNFTAHNFYGDDIRNGIHTGHSPAYAANQQQKLSQEIKQIDSQTDKDSKQQQQLHDCPTDTESISMQSSTSVLQNNPSQNSLSFEPEVWQYEKEAVLKQQQRKQQPQQQSSSNMSNVIVQHSPADPEKQLTQLWEQQMALWLEDAKQQQKHQYDVIEEQQQDTTEQQTVYDFECEDIYQNANQIQPENHRRVQQQHANSQYQQQEAVYVLEESTTHKEDKNDTKQQTYQNISQQLPQRQQSNHKSVYELEVPIALKDFRCDIKQQLGFQPGKQLDLRQQQAVYVLDEPATNQEFKNDRKQQPRLKAVPHQDLEHLMQQQHQEVVYVLETDVVNSQNSSQPQSSTDLNRIWTFSSVIASNLSLPTEKPQALYVYDKTGRKYKNLRRPKPDRVNSELPPVKPAKHYFLSSLTVDDIIQNLKLSI